MRQQLRARYGCDRRGRLGIEEVGESVGADVLRVEIAEPKVVLDEAEDRTERAIRLRDTRLCVRCDEDQRDAHAPRTALIVGVWRRHRKVQRGRRRNVIVPRPRVVPRYDDRGVAVVGWVLRNRFVDLGHPVGAVGGKRDVRVI